MLRERVFFWLIFINALVAGGFYLYNQPQASLLVLAIASLITLASLYALKTSIGSFSKIHIGSKVNSIFKLFSVLENKFHDQQQEVSQIIEVLGGIGSKEQESEIQLNGEVGLALKNLQQKLNKVKEVEEQRIWAAQGIASISAIRKDNSELVDYSFQTLCQLVKFLKANQGAFYIQTDEEEPKLELLSTYAYGRRKHSIEKIVLENGTGLVGQCALGREMILMTDVPKDYVKITSGLGEALPRCIIILPLLFREEIFGVIELAAFEKFPPYQIEFITKACEVIALELSGVRAHERTRKLLEQSREAELSQSLEEMKTAQKQMLMKEEELSRQLITTKRAMAMAEAEQKKNEAILEGCMDAVVSFNQEGEVEYFNKAAEDVFGVSRHDVVGRPVENLLRIHIVENNNDDFKILSVTGNEVSLRTEINTFDSRGEEISLLLTATKVKIDHQYLFTLFAQKVSVDLF